MDPDSSSLHYVSTKKDHIAEINTFTHEATGSSAMAGSIDASGQALLEIDLNAVSTGIATRDSRLLNLLFETALMPRAFLRVSVDIAGVEAMAAGQTRSDALLGELSLHGARQGVVASVLIAKLSDSAFTVSTLAPVIVDSTHFDMALGIEALRNVAGLSVIGESVPVYFNLSYRRSNDASAEGLAFPEAPAQPTELAGSFNANTAEAALAWLDNSDVETDYLLRRRSVEGDWATVAELPPNSMYFEEGLPDSGEFDYKVVALNQGMPSLPSNIERVSVTEGNQLVRGENHYAAQCAGCHGSQAEGTANFPPLNTARDMATLISYIATNMPLNNATSCGEDCAEDVAAFIQTLWVEETACNLQLSPVSYGARQLKMLTQFEYQNSVEDLIGIDYQVADGLSADTKIGFFYNNTHSPVTAAAYSNYLLVAEEVAAWSAQRNFSPALDCDGFGPG
ncbi:MAG: DUF1587 domain-containing protein, partial [Pseudomonadota bacterium]